MKIIRRINTSEIEPLVAAAMGYPDAIVIRIRHSCNTLGMSKSYVELGLEEPGNVGGVVASDIDLVSIVKDYATIERIDFIHLKMQTTDGLVRDADGYVYPDHLSTYQRKSRGSGPAGEFFYEIIRDDDFYKWKTRVIKLGAGGGFAGLLSMLPW